MERKTLKKAQTCKTNLTYGSHHRPWLPSVLAVVACWHPTVALQEGNNPGQRNCDKESESLADKTRASGRGRMGCEQRVLLWGAKAYWRLQKTGARELSGVQLGLVEAQFLTYPPATNSQCTTAPPLLRFTSACNKCKYKWHIPSL